VLASGWAFAEATGQFLAGRAGGGLAWLGLLVLASVLGALGTRQATLPSAAREPSGGREIGLRDVRFGYGLHAVPVIDGLSLRIPGWRVVIPQQPGLAGSGQKKWRVSPRTYRPRSIMVTGRIQSP
jgi:hypothetical protein